MIMNLTNHISERRLKVPNDHELNASHSRAMVATVVEGAATPNKEIIGLLGAGTSELNDLEEQWPDYGLKKVIYGVPPKIFPWV